MKCEVIKDVFCDNCTEEEAKTEPWSFAGGDAEVDMRDWEVIRVEANE